MIQKFPPNDIISLLDVNLEHNLAESTSEDLRLGDLLDETLQGALADIRLGYGSSKGGSQLRRAVAEKVGVNPESVLITNGAASGLFMTTFCLCGQGDEVVVTQPNFPPTLDSIAAVGAAKKPLNLSFDSGYKLDLSELARLLSANTRLVILVSPQNPSGIATSLGEVEAVLDVMQEKAPRAYLLLDETYREATYGDEPPQPSAAALGTRVLTTASLSKCHGAPGLRLGWLSCHDEQLMQQLTLAKMNTVISCSVVDETIGLHVLRNGDELLLARSKILAKAVVKVEAWVANNSEFVEWVKPDAGALCCVRLKHEVFGDAEVEQFYDLAHQHDVQLAKGSWFAEDARVFRLGFGYLPLEQLQPALDTLSYVLGTAHEQPETLSATPSR